MDLELTVVAIATGTRADVRVTAADASPAADLLDALRTVVGVGAAAPMSIAGRPIPAGGCVADCGLVPGAVIDVGDQPQPPTRADLELAVISGPDAGRRLALTPGEHIVGRDAGCGLVINDASISRHHLRFTVAASTLTVVDLGSVNGTTIDGRNLPANEAASVLPGATMTLGRSVVRLVEVGPITATTALPGGRFAIQRAPRLRPPESTVTVDFPAQPAAPTRVRVPLLAAAAPLVAGVVLAVVLHQWQLLAFTALSPIMIVGQAMSDRFHNRRTTRADRREFAGATAAARRTLHEALAVERQRRELASPDLGVLGAAAQGPTPLLWHRGIGDVDALRLRLGRGELPAEVRVNGGPGGATLADVPVCVDLAELAALGLHGPADEVGGLARSLLIQAATLHDPDQLAVVVIAPDRIDHWSWVRWLPHVADRTGRDGSALVGFDPQQAAARIRELRDDHRDRARHTLVVVDATRSSQASTYLAGLDGLIAHPDPTLSVIWCATDDRELPTGCDAVAEVTASPAATLTLHRSGHRDHSRIDPDLVATEVASEVARALSPLRVGAAEHRAELPLQVAWRDLLAIAVQDRQACVAALARRWAVGPSTTIALGVAAGGIVRVDLCDDGPHALVAGTTGAGKSELLLTLVASLVAANRPDQLSLLLIDHKGGATFAPCGRLPHAVGVMTDLDPASTRRALLSLTAEVRRRETLFAAAGAVDLAAYVEATRGDPAATAMARLVIVVDEFAALAADQPDFIGGLVGIAQRGRSLGVHLVLATQRPDGVVSADIRANTRLRICLGVARENESRDVIDCADAASISPSTPGRAYVRVGPGDLTQFQSARVGGPRPAGDTPLVMLSPTALLGAPAPAATVATDRETDLDVLIDAAVDAAAALGCPSPLKPWLPPLTDQLTVTQLPRGDRHDLVPWGLADLPALGRQIPLELGLSVGATTLVTGTARSGRTTALLTIATGAAATLSPDELHLWAIDGSTGLATLADLPHCGAVLAARDTDQVEHLLDHLTEQVTLRRHAPDDVHPTTMLLVDSWEALVAAGGDHDGGRLSDSLLRLATEGPSGGLQLVIATDRGGLTGRLATVATARIVLRLADRADFAMIGLAGRDLPRELPPGRGVRVGDLAIVQIATVDAVTATAARAWPAARLAARRFDPLPTHLAFADLVTAGAHRGGVVLGVAAADLLPVVVSRDDLGTGFVVAGPPGSGRTSALRVIAQQLTGRQVAVCCPRASPLLDQAAAIHLPPHDQPHAVALLDSLRDNASAPYAVLIDDVDLLTEGPLWPCLEDLIRGGSGSGCSVVLAGSTDAMTAAFRGPVALARRARTGLLLSPSGPHDGELFGVRLPRRARATNPPGRGWLAIRGVGTRLQLAYPSTELELSRLGERSRE
jgi:DNA segregation ATPase FtsK/SpoIIIE, S-DNA-T family